MNESISLSGRIGRAIAVTVLSFFLMVYLFHFIGWLGGEDGFLHGSAPWDR